MQSATDGCGCQPNNNARNFKVPDSEIVRFRPFFWHAISWFNGELSSTNERKGITMKIITLCMTVACVAVFLLGCTPESQTNTPTATNSPPASTNTPSTNAP